MSSRAMLNKKASVEVSTQRAMPQENQLIKPGNKNLSEGMNELRIFL